jgi:NADPH2:quinone reductase
MRAWLVEKQTGAEDLRIVERPIPKITGTEVLVRLTAPGVVPFDAAIINNENEPTFPPAALPNIPGNQGAGIVEESGVAGFRRGERVMFGAFPYGFMRPGSWAEFVAVEADHLSHIPDSISDGAAAQAAVAYPTAWFALRESGFAAGKTVLIPGIGGSVGNAAYQLARALGAAKVLSTAGSKAKAAAAQRAGFDNVIDLSSERLLEGVHARNAGQNVDIVIDSLGGQIIAEAIKCLNRYGKAIVLGFSAGRQSTITLAHLILVRGSIQGYGAYTCTPAEWREAWSLFRKLADESRIKPIFDRSFPFESAREAVRYVAQARPFGGVALAI